MSAVAFYTAVFLQGLVWLALGRRSWGAGLCIAAAYPLGLLLWLAEAAVLVGVGVPFTPVATALVMLLGLGLGVAVHVRNADQVGARDVSLALAATAGFFLAAAGVNAFDVSVWSYDSHILLATGRSIAFFGRIAPELAPELTARAPLNVMIQAASIPVGDRALQAAPALLGITSLASFSVLGLRGLRALGCETRWAVVLVAVTVLSVASNYWLVAQALYIHDNYSSGVFLFLFAACFWFADLEEDASWCRLAFAFLIAFSFQRLEAPIVAGAFLAIARSESRLPVPLLDRLTWVWALPLLAWYLVVARFTQFGEPPLSNVVLTTDRAIVISGGIAATPFALMALARPAFDRVRPFVPLVLLAGLAVAVAVVLKTSPKGARVAVDLLSHMTWTLWGGIWIAFAVLAVIAFLLPRVPMSRFFVVGALVHLGFLFIPQGAFTGQPDSRGRALTHVVLLIYFWLMLVYGSRRTSTEGPDGGP